MDIKLLTDIVWLNTGFLGDIILNSAAIDLVHEKYPHIRQSLITTSIGEQVYEKDPRLANIFVFHKRQSQVASFFQTRREIKKTLSTGEGKRQIVLLQAHRSY